MACHPDNDEIDPMAALYGIDPATYTLFLG